MIRCAEKQQSVPFGEGEGKGTPPPTAAAGEGTDGGVGAGELRCCTPLM